MLRQEVYAEDGTGNLSTLYSTTEQTCTVVLLQPRAGNRYASFRVDQAEAISYAYELDLTTGDPDPRVTHALTLAVDDYGNVLRSAAVSSPRPALTPGA